MSESEERSDWGWEPRWPGQYSGGAPNNQREVLEERSFGGTGFIYGSNICCLLPRVSHLTSLNMCPHCTMRSSILVVSEVPSSLRSVMWPWTTLWHHCPHFTDEDTGIWRDRKQLSLDHTEVSTRDGTWTQVPSDSRAMLFLPRYVWVPVRSSTLTFLVLTFKLWVIESLWCVNLNKSLLYIQNC